MVRIRTISTRSKNTSVQIIETISHGKIRIIKHIGTGHNPEEIENLKELAKIYINQIHPSILFPDKENTDFTRVENLELISYGHDYAYKFLAIFYNLIGFNNLNNKLLQDLSIIRIIEPAYKIQSIELLKKYFGIKYSEGTLNRGLLEITKIKNQIENCAIEYAKRNLNFNFSLIFYDVTTLYYESFKEDDFRKAGFSKDNKSNQPQIVIGLIVNKDGFPISIQTYKGNTFEGKTFIPSILKLCNLYNIQRFTVVADAGMLSEEHMKELEKNKLFYIVGARVANLPKKEQEKISKSLNKTEKTYYKTKTKNGILICDYSQKRANKDKSDREKQIKKAKKILGKSQTINRLPKYIKQTEGKFSINEDLITQSEIKDGIKGYYTNLKGIKEQKIIEKYHELWHVEKSFRISKSDLSARPIYLRKKEKILAHIMIIFTALSISKAIEIKTKMSIKKVRDYIWEIININLKDKITGIEYTKSLQNQQSNNFMNFIED